MAGKPIVLCFDGTWNTPSNTASPLEDVSTNVFRFYERVGANSSAGMIQGKWYNKGVGTEWLKRLRGGAFGLGLDEHILEGYRQLAARYADGDDVYLVGFSRGAYTARSLVGLIRNCGLLKNLDEDLLQRAYAVYRSKEDVDSEHAIAFRRANSREIRIKFLGVWDTVGALGVPLKPFAEFNAEQYGFHDTKLSAIVENAFQALALDEHRKPYAAALWQPQDIRDRQTHQRLEQVWFPGAHADVGGGYEGSHPVADLALWWMQHRAIECGLAVEALPRPNDEDIVKSEIHDSFSSFLGGLFSIFSSRFYRTVGRQTPDAPDHDPSQAVHATVFKRLETRADYRPKNPGLFDTAQTEAPTEAAPDGRPGG